MSGGLVATTSSRAADLVGSWILDIGLSRKRKAFLLGKLKNLKNKEKQENLINQENLSANSGAVRRTRLNMKFWAGKTINQLFLLKQEKLINLIMR